MLHSLMAKAPDLPAQVTELLTVLVRKVREALSDNVVGIYLRGSLATGDFWESSDVDVLVATERPVNDAELSLLAALHSELTGVESPYASRIEAAYIDRAALRTFTPGLRHPTLYWAEPFRRSEHDTNWVLERWTTREHGVTLYGPDPKTLIDPVSPDDLRDAVRARLRAWAQWAADPGRKLWPIVYTAETMCRSLYTLEHGKLPNKADAVQWALDTLPEPWRTTVVEAQALRHADTHDRSLAPAVVQFVLWTAAEAAAARS
jgi:predicted nucleotidyltransferase